MSDVAILRKYLSCFFVWPYGHGVAVDALERMAIEMEDYADTIDRLLDEAATSDGLFDEFMEVFVSANTLREAIGEAKRWKRERLRNVPEIDAAGKPL